LIRDPRQAFITAQYGKNIEYSGRGGPPAESRAQRLGYLAELDAFGFAHIA
jgi:hypothetical protein